MLLNKSIYAATLLHARKTLYIVVTANLHLHNHQRQITVQWWSSTKLPLAPRKLWPKKNTELLLLLALSLPGMTGLQLNSPPQRPHHTAGGGKVGATCLRPVKSNAGFGDHDRAAQKAPDGMAGRQTHTQSVHYVMITISTVIKRQSVWVFWHTLLAPISRRNLLLRPSSPRSTCSQSLAECTYKTQTNKC